jgi:hypothetical protein
MGSRARQKGENQTSTCHHSAIADFVREAAAAAVNSADDPASPQVVENGRRRARRRLGSRLCPPRRSPRCRTTVERGRSRPCVSVFASDPDQLTVWTLGDFRAVAVWLAPERPWTKRPSLLPRDTQSAHHRVLLRGTDSPSQQNPGSGPCPPVISMTHRRPLDPPACRNERQLGLGHFACQEQDEYLASADARHTRFLAQVRRCTTRGLQSGEPESRQRRLLLSPDTQ